MKLTLRNVTPFEPEKMQTTFQPGQAATTQGYQAPEKYTPEGMDTVQGQMTGLLNQNSGYMQTARKSGERVAQSRGLLNSGLAGEYGQKAAIESSLPIAQQDASQRFQAGMADYEGKRTGSLADQQYGNEANLANLQAENTAKLATQTASQESTLMAQEGTQKAQIERMNNEARKELVGMELSANEDKAAASSVTLLGDTLLSNIVKIDSDPNMSASAKSKAIRNAQNAYYSMVKNIGNIYGVKVSWK